MASGGSLARAVSLALLMMIAAMGGCVQSLAPAAARDEAATEDSVFSDTRVFEGEYNTRKWRIAAQGEFDVLSQDVTLLKSELDGVDIMVYVMRPDVPEGQKVPVIVDAGPYFPPLEGMDLSDSTFLTDFVSHGYAFALVSVRGTGNSGGCMDLMGPAERHDMDQAITWLGTQEWSNGNVGMFGGSYDGSTQWTAASTGNPHLKTIVPLAAIPDLFSFMIRNGTAMAWTPATFVGIYWALYGPVLYNPATGRSADSTAEQLVCPESMKGIAGSVESTLTGERDALGWWEARDWRDEVLANYNGSIYLIHGLQDITVEPHTAYPFVEQLEGKGLVVKHTLGPWGHELPWRADSLDILLHWYDRWLKENATVDLGPRAQVMDNLGLWRSETAWPPEDATPTVFHLTAGMRLSPEAGGAAEPIPVAPMVPAHDPVAYAGGLNWYWKVWENPENEVCPACPTFATEPLEEELRFAGLPRLHVSATPTGPGGHLTAILRAVHPDGSWERVGMGQMDLRFAAGDGTSTPVVPGRELVARMELQPTDAVVPVGSKLVLTIHQGSYGLRIPSTPTYPVLLDVSPEKSTLTLDAFTRGPEAFHEAPPRVGEGPPR